MKRFVPLFLFVLCAGDWPAWRGPRGDGSAEETFPLKWSATENVVWKIPTPGVGHSSPIVVKGRVLLTAFVKGQRLLLCYDRKTGEERWRVAVLEAGAEKMHKANTPASSTPASDGERVFSTFTDGGKIVAACHSLDGKPLWKKEFAGFDSRHGFCGSPVLHDGLVFINGDSDGDAFLAGLDAKTGEQKWKVERPNKIRSFSAPLIVGDRLILAGSQSVAMYEPKTGKRRWSVPTAAQKFVATAAHANGVILATGTSPEPTLMGIDEEGKTLWSGTKNASYVPSPVAVGKRFLLVNDKGVAVLMEAKTGEAVWTKRLGRAFDASPLRLGKHVVCLDTDGIAWILGTGDKFEVEAKNELGEACHATPAASDGQLFIRTTKNLWCIGGKR